MEMLEVFHYYTAARTYDFLDFWPLQIFLKNFVYILDICGHWLGGHHRSVDSKDCFYSLLQSDLADCI